MRASSHTPAQRWGTFLIPVILMGVTAALIFLEINYFRFLQKHIIFLSETHDNTIDTASYFSALSTQHILLMDVLMTPKSSLNEADIYIHGRAILDELDGLKKYFHVISQKMEHHLTHQGHLKRIETSIALYYRDVTTAITLSTVSLDSVFDLMRNANTTYATLNSEISAFLDLSRVTNRQTSTTILRESNRIRTQFIMILILLSLMISIVGVWLSRTITSLRTSQGELLEAKDQLEHKINFISIASHDLKSPLSILKETASHLLIETGISHAQQKKAYEILQNQAENALMLTTDLLDISAMETGILGFKKGRIYIRKFIKGICDSMDILIKQNNMQLIIHEIDPTLVVQGDAMRLEQLLRNLLSNAIKYASGRSINISAHEVGRNQRHYAMVSISDEGPGIPTDKLKDIFNPFSQAHSEHRRKGTGLGLAICKKICEQHQGEIWVESTEGKGTSFSFLIPVEENSSHAQIAA